MFLSSVAMQNGRSNAMYDLSLIRGHAIKYHFDILYRYYIFRTIKILVFTFNINLYGFPVSIKIGFLSN